MQAASLKPTKIEIISQPRQKFRPRTQNESKNSSHYLRCADGDKNEHPTIHVSISLRNVKILMQNFIVFSGTSTMGSAVQYKYRGSYLGGS